MDIKKLALIFFLSFFACSLYASEDPKEKTLLLNYALAICLGAAFDDDAVKKDFNKSANGYMQRGNFSVDGYEELRTLSVSWLKRNYKSKHGGQVQSAKCFDFFRSPEVQSLYDKYDPCKDNQAWLDQDEYQSSCKKIES